MAPVLPGENDLLLAADSKSWILSRLGATAVMAGDLETGKLSMHWLQ